MLPSGSRVLRGAAHLTEELSLQTPVATQVPWGRDTGSVDSEVSPSSSWARVGPLLRLPSWNKSPALLLTPLLSLKCLAYRPFVQLLTRTTAEVGNSEEDR